MRDRELRAGLVLATLCAASLTSAVRAQAPSKEQTLKAEFVERFTRFIDWPQETMRPGGLFHLCVVGRTPVGTRLQHLARVRIFKGRSASFRGVISLDELRYCHLVFVAGSERGRLSEILRRTSGRPILTVGDTPGYADRGVIINLVPAGRTLRFEINVAAALESGLRFRSKLLKLARLVGEPGGGEP